MRASAVTMVTIMTIKASKSLFLVLVLVTLSVLCIFSYTINFTNVVTLRSKERTSKDNNRSHTKILQHRPASVAHSLQKQEDEGVSGLWMSDEEVKLAKLKVSIAKDMQKCSLTMGLSPEVLNKAEGKIMTIAERAAFFLKTFWEVVPKKFLPQFKNPCWYSNVTIGPKVSNYLIQTLYETIPESKLSWLHRELYEKPHTNHTLHCLPYFLVPGIPKSGTTTLHFALSHHPQIMAPKTKEPQWWYRPPLTNKTHLEVVIGRYLTNFLHPSFQIGRREDGPSLITYDASQTTMVNVFNSSFQIDNEDYCALPAVISRVLPNARIIVLMREPIARLYSYYLFQHGQQQKNWPKKMISNPPLYFDRHIVAQIVDFQWCLTNSSVYECVNQVRTNFEELKVWLGVSIYYIHIQKWLQFWPRENFLFLKTEDMSSNPNATLRNVTDFLGLQPYSEEEAVRLINNRQNVQKNKSKVSPTAEYLLKALFEPFNKKLEELVGVKF